MIVYEPNKNWLKDVFHLTTSFTIRKILFGVLVIGIYTTSICFILTYFQMDPRLHSGIFSLLAVVLSIVLVFRTNSAYDRWWEGRKQWGALVNNCRNLAVMLQASLPDEDKDSRFFFAKQIANFCIALKNHLRQGVEIDELIYVDQNEIEALEGKAHKPNFISYLIYKKIQQIYRGGVLSDADFINIKPQHQALLDILGACERIKKTPIPFSYAVYIKLFVTIYGIILPFGLFNDFGFYMIPLVMLIFFAMLGLELMAEEIEEPFGVDCNDLPTADIAHTIKNNVFEILEQSHKLKLPVKKELYQKVH